MNTTEKEYAEELCNQLGISSKDNWGTVNNALCDAYWQGRRDAIERIRSECLALANKACDEHVGEVLRMLSRNI